MAPRGKVVHRTPSRVRLRIPEKRGDAAYFSRVRESLAEHGTVGQVEVNPISGSILMVFAGDFGDVAKFAAERELFSLEDRPLENGRPSLANTAKGMYHKLDGRIRRWTNGDLNLPDATFLALVAGGVYQIARGNFAAPAWYTAFWYGLNIFLKAEGTQEEDKASLV